MTAAGVLPLKNGQILLGRDLGNSWSAFGGKQESNENERETAYREFMEETCYMFTSFSFSDFIKRIIYLNRTKTPSGNDFFQYVVSFEGVDETSFHPAQSKLPRRICFFEKHDVQWFSTSRLPFMKRWFLREINNLKIKNHI
jgi:8-oxo-dGTP pyrophosphatase MutT (NUDIX family)